MGGTEKDIPQSHLCRETVLVIFVTVGTYKGDELIGAIDEIATGLNEEIIAQIGYGEYEPKNFTFFRRLLSCYFTTIRFFM